MKDSTMNTNHRFYLNADNKILDELNPANNEKAEWVEGLDYYPKNEQRFRELLLWRCLVELLPNLIINTNPIEKGSDGENDQSLREERFSIFYALHATIQASHLNTLDIALSLQHKFGGELKRKKSGWQDSTSLSLFVDDVERLLRDLYGESDNHAIDRLRHAVFVIVSGFTEHLRRDLWQEHRDAQDIDYVDGIGVPEGSSIHGSDCGRAEAAADNLALRARAARADPTGFSKYTVEFVNELYAHVPWLAEPSNPAQYRVIPNRSAVAWRSGCSH
jgi:hypothetical protein